MVQHLVPEYPHDGIFRAYSYTEIARRFVEGAISKFSPMMNLRIVGFLIAAALITSIVHLEQRATRHIYLTPAPSPNGEGEKAAVQVPLRVERDLGVR